MSTDPTRWSRRAERGSMFWLRTMARLSLGLGRSTSRLLLPGIALYFLLASPQARRASHRYLARVLGRTPRWREQFRHFSTFASCIHDRVYLVGGRSELFAVEVVGGGLVDAAVASGRGLFLLGAHLGSFEVLRAIGRAQPGFRVAMVMYPETARRLDAILAAIAPEARQDVIALGEVDSMLRVQAALDGGALVGMLGDREGPGDTPGALRRLRFLGGEVAFPLGPLRLAALLRRPVVLMAGLYRGDNRYTVRFEPLADFSSTTRAERDAAVEAALLTYVARLEALCREAPYNWFNFHEVWDPTAGDDRDAG